MPDAILNNQGDGAADSPASGLGNPGADASVLFPSDRDTYPTILIRDAIKSAQPEGGDKGGDKDKGTETPSGETEKKTEAPTFDFETHPKYKEMAEKITHLSGAMETMRDLITRMGGPGAERGGGQPDEKPDFIDVMSLPEDKFREMQDTDPRALFANMGRQLVHEIKESLKGELSTQTESEKRASALKEFAGKNPDFIELYRSGAIKGLLESSPLHTPISAFYELSTPKKIEAALKEQAAKHKTELETAVKKAREEEKNSILARSGARVLGSGPAISPAAREGVSDELKNSKAHGGITSVLLKRHLAREAARSG